MRINGDIRKVEIIDADGHPVSEGTYGSVVVTDLENTSFPMIRYQLGDRSALKPRTRDTSHPYPLMESVQGRVSERILSRSGATLTGEFLTTIFDDYADEIRQFKIHQYSDYSVMVSVVPRAQGEKLETILGKVKNTLRMKLGCGAEVDTELLSKIEHDRGKLRFITTDFKEGNCTLRH